MSGVCNGICPRYKVTKPKNGGRYAANQKRCKICEIFIKYEGVRCPCCGYKLRIKARYSKSKTNLEEKRSKSY